jgi:aspartyl-tRNA(Asn)/glutamyl-tRNA(Gln) amidotransferase subunit C
MPERLNRDEVLRIAALAQLALTEDEIDAFAAQLGAILGYVQQIRELDTTGVEPTAHVLSSRPNDRPDLPHESLPGDAAMANAPDRAKGVTLFRVPRVIG